MIIITGNHHNMMLFMNNLGLDTLISTISSNYIIKHFELDYSYFGILFAVIMNTVGAIKTDLDIKTYIMSINIYFWLLFLLAFILYHFRSQIRENIKCCNSNTHTQINIYDPEKITVFMDYMNFFPDFFNKVYDVDVGNSEFIGEYLTAPESQHFNDDFYTNMNLVSAICDTKIHFDDKNFKVKGYLVWDEYEYSHKIVWHPTSNNTKNADSDKLQYKKLKIKYMKLYLDKYAMIDINKYIKEVEKIVFDKQLNNDITKYNYKVFKNNNGPNEIHYHAVQIYCGPKKTIEDNEKLYIDTFFHKEKDRLWSHIKSIQTDPLSFKKLGQSPRLNLLLYGPPGSGKSSLAYRIAMCLNRHLVSVDLREIKNKATIYNILHNPYHESYKASEVIFILDEFDLTIKHLYNTEQTRKEHLKMVYDSQRLAKRLKAIMERDNGTIKSKEKKTPTKHSDSDSEEDTKKKSTAKNKDEEDTIFTDPSENEFTLKDLLEIFQGAVPIDGMIIIATTNDYHGIKKLCPELFRPGRLTPIEFGYLDKPSLQALSKFYFGKELNIDNFEEFNVPTSQIIEKALELKSKINSNNENIFEEFQQFILQVK
jgi:hypothetical protein